MTRRRDQNISRPIILHTYLFVLLWDTNVAQDQQGEVVFLAMKHASIQKTKQGGNQASILGTDHVYSCIVDSRTNIVATAVVVAVAVVSRKDSKASGLIVCSVVGWRM